MPSRRPRRRGGRRRTWRSESRPARTTRRAARGRRGPARLRGARRERAEEAAGVASCRAADRQGGRIEAPAGRAWGRASPRAKSARALCRQQRRRSPKSASLVLRREGYQRSAAEAPPPSEGISTTWRFKTPPPAPILKQGVPRSSVPRNASAAANGLGEAPSRRLGLMPPRLGLTKPLMVAATTPAGAQQRSSEARKRECRRGADSDSESRTQRGSCCSVGLCPDSRASDSEVRGLRRISIYCLPRGPPH